MSPKKKLSKEEQEAERLRLEAAAQEAEQERIRQEDAAERQRQEEMARKAEIAKANEETENVRLADERLKFQSLADEAFKARCTRLQSTKSADESTRYISCNPLPKPEDESCMADYLTAESSREPVSVNDALTRMHAALTIINEIDHISIRTNETGAGLPVLSKYKAGLYNLISSISDMVTAWFLYHCDYFADEEGAVKHEDIVHTCQWGLWLNINKNPRLKLLEFPRLQCSIEILKQVALAPIAIRAQLLPTSDAHNAVCTNQLVAIGNVMTFELLTLPPASKATVNQWVIRVQSPLSHSVSKIPYPIPPAGADPSMWTPDEDVPPLAIMVAELPSMVQLSDDPLQVAIWDEKDRAWNTTKVQSVDASDGKLTFRTTALGSFAMVYNRCALLPYHAWHIRPSAGEGGNMALLSVDVGIDDMPLEFEVGPGHVMLKGPMLRPLVPLLGVAHRPLALLRALQKLGMFLLPTAADAPRVDVEEKDKDVERAMCEDVAALAGSHIVASSKWTQYVGEQECICRLSEVTDWEAGGRSSEQDVARIFEMELETGPLKVLAMVRRGTKGVALSCALNRCEAYPELPAMDNERCRTCIWGEVHASPYALLQGAFSAELVDELELAIALREEEDQKLRVAEARRTAELEELAKKGEKPPDELLQTAVLPPADDLLYWPTDWPKLVRELQPAEGTLERIRGFSPLTCETLAQLLFEMRIFSFSVA
eukprot:jgi/Ulvmu1/4686/UM002_0417.1